MYNFSPIHQPVASLRINISSECLKWHPMLPQKLESMLRQTLHVRVASKIKRFWLVQITFCVMTLHTFRPFVVPNVISDGTAKGLSIRKFIDLWPDWGLNHQPVQCHRDRWQWLRQDPSAAPAGTLRKHSAPMMLPRRTLPHPTVWKSAT